METTLVLLIITAVCAALHKTEDVCSKGLEQLEQKVADQSNWIEMLQKTTDELAKQNLINNDHAKKVDNIISESNLMNSQEPLHATKSKRQESSFPVVAFTAVKTDIQNNVGVNQNIFFDNIVLNEGGGFHPQHGLFIAPARGIYFFTATVLHPPQANIYLHAAITHNGQDVALLHSAANIWDQGTQTVILKIEPGDEIWVRNVHYGGEIVNGWSYTTFSSNLVNAL